MGSLDLPAFLEEARNLEKEQQLFRQNHSGFSAHAVNGLALSFMKLDTDNSGALGSRELVALIENILPGVATAPEHRPMLANMLQEARGRSGDLTESDTLACCVDQL